MIEELIQKGGPVIWVLTILSVYGMGVIAERLFYFHRIRINIGDLLRGLSRLLRKGAYAEALHEVSRAPGPMARVVEAAVSRYEVTRAELSMIVQEATQLEVFRVEKNIRGLLTVATVAPLVGLLGTFMALIKFYSEFNNLADGRITGKGMSQAIFEALLSSAAGLVIAIPAYLFYMYLAAKARLVINEIERAGIETINIISDGKRREAEEKKVQEKAASESKEESDEYAEKESASLDSHE